MGDSGRRNPYIHTDFIYSGSVCRILQSADADADTAGSILILTPILLPIVENIGVNPVHFGIIMVVNLAVGFVTPPIGVNLFVASSLSDVPVMKIAKQAMPMIGTKKK